MSELDKIAARETIEYLKRRNLLLLEAVVGCLLDTNNPKEVVEILRTMANQLEDYG